MLRPVEDNPGQEAVFAFQPVPLGTIEERDGKQWKVVNNYQTYVVTYEEVKEEK